MIKVLRYGVLAEGSSSRLFWDITIGFVVLVMLQMVNSLLRVLMIRLFACTTPTVHCVCIHFRRLKVNSISGSTYRFLDIKHQYIKFVMFINIKMQYILLIIYFILHMCKLFAQIQVVI